MRLLLAVLFAGLLASCGGSGDPASSVTEPKAFKLASPVSGDTETVLHLYQALHGKAPSNPQLSTFKSQIAASGVVSWVNTTAAEFNSLSNRAFAERILYNISITPTSLAATPTFGTSLQAYNALLAGFADYLSLVGVDSRGVVAAQLTKIISGLEVDTQFGVYGGAALALNKQIASNDVYSADSKNLVAGVAPISLAAAGKVMNKIGASGGYARGVAIQPDGKIIVVGPAIKESRSTDVAVARYKSDGVLDDSFGESGVVTTNISGRIDSTDWVNAVAIQNDGKILVVGSSQKNGEVERGLVLLRYSPEGNLDPSFAGAGIIKILDSAKDTSGTSLAIQPDGKIIVGGIVSCFSRSNASQCTLLQRYNLDGTPDASFNGPGLSRVDFNTDGVRGMSLLRNGKILVVGSKDSGNGFELSVARYSADGQADTNFGVSGVATVAIGLDVGSANYGTGIAVQSDGKILVSGQSYTLKANSHFSLTRLTENGQVDTSFGKLGSVVTNVATPPQSDFAWAMTIQPDGKILVGGEIFVERTNIFPAPGFVQTLNKNFALVRYMNNGSLDSTFGRGGIVTTDVNMFNDSAYGMALQPDGYVILVGEAFTHDPKDTFYGGFTSFALARYRTDGFLDTAFGR